jgi:hypothetical protein
MLCKCKRPLSSFQNIIPILHAFRREVKTSQDNSNQQSLVRLGGSLPKESRPMLAAADWELGSQRPYFEWWPCWDKAGYVKTRQLCGDAVNPRCVTPLVVGFNRLTRRSSVTSETPTRKSCNPPALEVPGLSLPI